MNTLFKIENTEKYACTYSIDCFDYLGLIYSL